jgi:SPOR domain
VPPRQHAAVLHEMENSPMRSTPSAAPGASRRARDALLLELGALVYELHRKGERAPELLHAKAVALDQVQAGLTPGEALPCPHCFAATEPGQLVCLECGETLGLGAPRVPRRRTPLIALAAVVALLGAAAAGFAVSELTSDDGGDTPAASAERVAAGKQSQSGGVAAAAESGDEEPVALAAWPDDLSAYTVVLVTSSDEAGARKVAWSAARSGLEAGLLHSDDYMELGEGFWLVFAGHFRTAAAAERRAAKLGERYEGAYPQQVVPSAQSPQ